MEFANRLGVEAVDVVVNTQPGEPYPYERAGALAAAVAYMPHVRVRHIHRTLEQNPEAPGFWDIWKGILIGLGFQEGDYVVASEPYGQKVAEVMGGHFFPYDIDRSLNSIKGDRVRHYPTESFKDILPEFRPNLQTRITIFGAESTGKTTLTQHLASTYDSPWAFEYARPYLEHTANKITPRSMTGIWKGQAALQRQIAEISDTPYILQDTDLYSTIGYWRQPHWVPILGPVPQELYEDARGMKSDLYIVTPSNIPFEEDPLRYGGDHRESGDDYWIDKCYEYSLPFKVLTGHRPVDRLAEAVGLIDDYWVSRRLSTLSYDRHGL